MGLSLEFKDKREMVSGRKIVLMIGWALGGFILFFLMISGRGDGFLNGLKCESERHAMEQDLNGLVERKYLDSINHMWRTVEVYANGRVERSYLFLVDQSDAFDFLKVGDTVVKSSGSLDCQIHRNGEVFRFVLNFDCDKSAPTLSETKLSAGQIAAVMIALAALLNIVVFWMKRILERRGQRVRYFGSQFTEVFSFFALAYSSKRFDYAALTVVFVVLILVFIYVAIHLPTL